jgi:hypothetical protein
MCSPDHGFGATGLAVMSCVLLCHETPSRVSSPRPAMALAWARIADVREVTRCECRVAVVSDNRRTFAFEQVGAAGFGQDHGAEDRPVGGGDDSDAFEVR